MKDEKLEVLRKYGYDILINRFEPLLRNVIKNEVLVINYGMKLWRQHIPEGIKTILNEENEFVFDDIDIDDFFDEIYLWGLKEIAISSDHYGYLQCLTGSLSKNRFIELIDELNEIRRKIAHAKSTFTRIDLARLIEIMKIICQGDIANEFFKYINNESYKYADEIPLTFFEEYDCPNNLPSERYDLDGGFVGRRKEIKDLIHLLYSDQDRIHTITGAGGIGKTAVALKTAYNILADENNPFEAIIWFSAKEFKLTSDFGIVKIRSDIKNCEQLVKDILRIIDSDTYLIFEENHMPYEKFNEQLNNIFSAQQCLLIIDNLETIKDEETLCFIKDIPRPSKVLITSRKGLGEIERRYSLPDFNKKDAILLFRLIAKVRGRIDLLKIEDTDIQDLVKKVRYYPLLIKWSIGKVCLGMDINDAFTEIYSGESEIAEFVFDDIFEMLSTKSKLCLYSMIIFGDRVISKHMLMHIANLDDDSFDDSIRELIITSFVIPEVESSMEGTVTNYSMLSLTKGFITHKLDQEKEILRKLHTRYYELSYQVEQLEKSHKAYFSSLFSIGIKTEDDKIAFNYVKSAKNYINTENYVKAEEYFKDAIKLSPNFSYAIIEYAKFEFNRGHTQNSNVLFQKAIEVDPENFHGFFSFGICLKKQNRLDEAIAMLMKALALNSEHLPIFNELGRTYSFKGNYETADEFFEQAKLNKQSPNFKHKFLTLLFQSDNYLRWSEAYLERNDPSGALNKMKQALDTIERANDLKKDDKRALSLQKKICRQIAIEYCQLNQFDKAVPYFESAIKPLILSNGVRMIHNQEMATALYFYAYYGFKLETMDKESLMKNLQKGIAINRDPKFIDRFIELGVKIKNKYKIESGDYQSGTIEWFNWKKHYGVIRSSGDSYFFLLRYFDRRLEDSEIQNLEGQNVNFISGEDSVKKDKRIALNIHLQSA